MFTKYLLRVFPGEGIAITELVCHPGDDPPVRSGLARRRQKRALAGDTAFRIGHRAVFLAPAQGGKTDMGKPAGVRLLHHLRYHDQRAGCQSLTHRVAVGKRHGRVGAHDPHRLHLAARNGVKQFHRHQARGLRQPFRSPETRHARKIVRLEVHVRRQLIRQPAHFPPAHGIWLSGQRKRAAARTVELPAGKMHVNDGVTLVAAGGGLVDPHGVERDRAWRGDKPVVEGANLV